MQTHASKIEVKLWCKKRVTRGQSQEGNGRDFKVIAWLLFMCVLVPKLAHSGMGIVHRTGSFWLCWTGHKRKQRKKQGLDVFPVSLQSSWLVAE